MKSPFPEMDEEIARQERDAQARQIVNLRPLCCNEEPDRQTTLFSGLDCLPGQENLFPTDGMEPASPDSV
jgi:hypothetical protein